MRYIQTIRGCYFGNYMFSVYLFYSYKLCMPASPSTSMSVHINTDCYFYYNNKEDNYNNNYIIREEKNSKSPVLLVPAVSIVNKYNYTVWKITNKTIKKYNKVYSYPRRRHFLFFWITSDSFVAQKIRFGYCYLLLHQDRVSKDTNIKLINYTSLLAIFSK